jgi:hypothetical protein
MRRSNHLPSNVRTTKTTIATSISEFTFDIGIKRLFIIDKHVLTANA